MAECAGTAAALLNFSGQKNDLVVGLEAADAELRKTCAWCKWFRARGGSHGQRLLGWCAKVKRRDFPEPVYDAELGVPADGSGYCHNWHAKEATR